MGLFGKKDSSPIGSQAAPASPLQPVDQVSAMKQQGYTNSQIISSLQRDGYSSSQIFDALNQVEMRMGSPIDGGSDFSEGQQSGQPPSTPSQTPYPDFQASTSQTPQLQSRSGAQNTTIPLTSDVSVEELVESVIDEKWNELVKDLNKIIDWKNSTEARMVSIEQQFKDMKDQFDRLHSAIVGKITDYDKNIQDVGSEIKAMEKVFSKVLPVFTDNVSELSRITERMKTVFKK
jgi:hypothetical protein